MSMGKIDSAFSVTVPRLEIITHLKANLEKHKADYELAVEKFYETAEKQLRASIKQLKDRPNKDVRVTMSFPVTYETSYQTAIEMLEMSVDDNITLSRDMFVKFIKDEWEWKNSFVSGTLSYLGGSL